jgi:GNAT superfamily N-acetyltransferase
VTSSALSHAGLDLRPYQPEMDSGMTDVWNAALGDTFPLSLPLFRQNTSEDPHFDPAGCWAACDPGDQRVRGFCVAKVAREPLGADGLLDDRGWISIIAVHPGVQRRGLGTALLRKAEEFLRRRGRPRAVLGGDPGHFFPGVPVEGASGSAAGTGQGPRESAALTFFGARGYRFRGDAYDLRRSLRGYHTPPLVDAEAATLTDLEVRPLRRGEETALLAFLDAVFPGRWRYTLGRFLAGGGAIGDVMGVVQGGAVLGFAHLFHPASRWIGPSIAWTRQGRSPAGGLGPMGLAPALRGRGLGLILLDRSMRHLARVGVEDMVIDWTVLLDFYGRLGFVPWKHYRHGERPL